MARYRVMIIRPSSAPGLYGWRDITTSHSTLAEAQAKFDEARGRKVYLQVHIDNAPDHCAWRDLAIK